MKLTAAVWNERDEKLNVNEIASLGRVAEVQKTFDEIFHGFYQKNMNHTKQVTRVILFHDVLLPTDT